MLGSKQLHRCDRRSDTDADFVGLQRGWRGSIDLTGTRS